MLSLNQNCNDREKYKFPYIPQLQVAFVEYMGISFKELWNAVSEKIFIHSTYKSTLIFQHINPCYAEYNMPSYWPAPFVLNIARGRKRP